MPPPDQPRPEATKSKFAAGSASPGNTGRTGPETPPERPWDGKAGSRRSLGLRRIFLKLGHRAGPMISHSIWSAHAGDRPRCRSCCSRSCRSRNGPFRINRVRSNRRTRFTRRPNVGLERPESTGIRRQTLSFRSCQNRVSAPAREHGTQALVSEIAHAACRLRSDFLAAASASICARVRRKRLCGRAGSLSAAIRKRGYRFTAFAKVFGHRGP
jgi:hypothetical protein